MKIFKYRLKESPTEKDEYRFESEMPYPHKILKLGRDRETYLSVWAEVDEDEKPMKVSFVVLPTGADVLSGHKHVYTEITEGGYVWHYYIEEKK